MIDEHVFTETALAASHILRFALEHPQAVSKSENPDAAIGELAKALARTVAEAAVPSYVAKMEARQAWLVKYEQDQAQRVADGRLHDITKCDHDACRWQLDDDAAYARTMAEHWAAKAAAIDNSRPHLDADRAERDNRIQSVPWRETEDGEPTEKPSPPAAVPGVSKQILDEAGFDDQGDNEYVHPRDGHVLKMLADGFLIQSGWDQRTVLKGDTIEDFREALALLDD